MSSFLDTFGPLVRRIPALFGVVQQSCSEKGELGRYVQGEEWHHCVLLVEECRILFIFKIWYIISLVGAQGLAPVFDMPWQGVTQKKKKQLLSVAHRRMQVE